MADLPERLQVALAHRYQLERALGHGGMASVYLAYDRKEGRPVALKVLAPELAVVVRIQRFHREIQYAKRLNHPGILQLFESDTADGVPYYTMPYVDGPSLQDRLAGEGPLPIDDVVRILTEIADALDHAHRRQIIHRDIKPANILLLEGHAVVADFGIARAIHEAEEPDITGTGVALGTPAYMSPEQTTSAHVDARSDIYSLGCLAYEMIEGRPPFERTSHRDDAVPPFRRPDVPPLLSAAVVRALEKDPTDRFATAGAFAAALRGAAAPWRPPRWLARVGGIMAAGVLALLFLGPDGRPSLPDVSIAVRTPTNLTRDTTDAYLGRGIAEDVISLLTTLPQIRVIGRQVDDTTLPNSEAARLLRVNYVLESSVRSNPDSVRFTARLLRVSDDHAVWSGTYDRPRESILALQKEIAWAIVRHLRLPLEGNEQSLVQPSCTEKPAAYEAYSRARDFWRQRSRQSMTLAIEHFRLAVDQDPEYACAYSGLADALILAGQFGYVQREQAYAQAKAAALRAVALDESLPEAHTSLARVYQNADWDWAQAEREYRRAIELNPRYVLARTWYGMFLARCLGRFEEAIQEVLAGHDLDPESPWTNNNVVVVMMHARRYDEAIEYARRAISLAPQWVTPRADLADTYRWKGMYAEALEEYRIAGSLGRDVRGAVGYIYARTGRRAEALRIRRDLEGIARQEFVWGQLATLYVGLGEHDLAIAALDSQVTTRSFSRGEPTLKTDPDWDPLRSDPRFAALLRRIGLPM